MSSTPSPSPPVGFAFSGATPSPSSAPSTPSPGATPNDTPDPSPAGSRKHSPAATSWPFDPHSGANLGIPQDIYYFDVSVNLALAVKPFHQMQRYVLGVNMTSRELCYYYKQYPALKISFSRIRSVTPHLSVRNSFMLKVERAEDSSSSASAAIQGVPSYEHIVSYEQQRDPLMLFIQSCLDDYKFYAQKFHDHIVIHHGGAQKKSKENATARYLVLYAGRLLMYPLDEKTKRPDCARAPLFSLLLHGCTIERIGAFEIHILSQSNSYDFIFDKTSDRDTWTALLKLQMKQPQRVEMVMRQFKVEKIDEKEEQRRKFEEERRMRPVFDDLPASAAMNNVVNQTVRAELNPLNPVRLQAAARFMGGEPIKH